MHYFIRQFFSYIKNIKFKQQRMLGWTVLIFFSVLFSASRAYADYSRYTPTEPITIGDFVYDDNYQITSASCSTTVYSPSGNVVVDDAPMTSLASGWHYYTLPASTTEGLWSASMYCGSTSTGDLIREDRSFIIASNRLSDKALDGGGSLATENYINLATATLKTSIDLNNTLISSLNNISALDVWSFVGRDLDRPIIVSASTSAAVWSSALNAFTEAGTIGKLIADNIDAKISTRSTSTLTAADVWSVTNRTLTDYATSTLTQAIWSNANRTLTAYGNDITAADVWNVLASSLSLPNSIGKQLADNTDAQISTIPNLVWSSGSRSLTDYSTSSIATAVWNQSNRSLTTFGTLVSDVWSDITAPNRQLTSGSLTGGGNIVSEDFLSTKFYIATSTIISEINQNRTLINNLNNISASDVWSATARTLTDYATSSVATAIWTSPIRSLTTFGTLVADIWSDLTAPNRQLTSGTLTGGGTLATNSNLNTLIDNATSSIITQILQNRTLINNLNNISALDVWSFAGRDLDNPTIVSASSSDAVWQKAVASLSSAGTIGKLFVDNIDAKISTRGTSMLTAADVWDAGNRTLTDYSTSSIALGVWANAARTLTSGGGGITAADVWNVMTSTLSTVGSIGLQLASNIDSSISTRATLVAQQAGWVVKMSDAEAVSAGKTYRAKVFVFNNESVATDANTTPTITLYDADRNVVANGVSMTNIATGIYEYTYVVANNASAGLWEAIASTQVTPGKTLQTNDFWTVGAAPAQVIINNVTEDATPMISGNITITNEGLSGYEYHYEWCIVSSADNVCGGGNDTFYASAAKFINPGDSWNTNLTGTVPQAGNYFFKLVVYFGTDHSSASRSFTAALGTQPPAETPPSGGGGGGGGGGGAVAVVTPPVVETKSGSTGFAIGESGTVSSVTNQSLSLVLSVPAEAIVSPTTITINPVLNDTGSAPKTVPNTSLEMVGNMFFDIKSSNGQRQFSEPLLLSFKYTDAQISSFEESSLKVYWYNETSKKWEGLPTKVNQNSNTLTAETNHFSLFSIFGQPKKQSQTCNGSDFNHDKKVNSVDFSILLAFWKTTPPWRNSCVDINHDNQVNSVEFSILMFEWGSLK